LTAAVSAHIPRFTEVPFLNVRKAEQTIGEGKGVARRSCEDSALARSVHLMATQMTWAAILNPLS
ncbi:MAG TPA: hypothetical protein VF506_16360, partial [Streptosporangiaceae bacterium]